jgi:hypothetical protein
VQRKVEEDEPLGDLVRHHGEVGGLDVPVHDAGALQLLKASEGVSSGSQMR